MAQTTLQKIHETLGGRFAPEKSRDLPDHYGDVRAEYEAIRKGVAIIDISSAGKLHVSGKNAVQFLNGLVSNDVRLLQAGEGMPAAFPTLQGKLLALSRIYNTGPYLLLELDAINREKIFQNLSRFIPAGEFFVTDVSNNLALISLQGPRAEQLVEIASGQITPFEPRYRIYEREIGSATVMIASHSRTGEKGFDIFAPTESAAKVWETLVRIGKDYDAQPAGQSAIEIARIDSGIPREGIDAGENYIILESELNEAVSYTKGCYLGQEVIARIHWRGQPARRLKRLLIDASPDDAAGAELHSADGRKIGEVTSAAHSFALDRTIGLGYVHRNYLEPGSEFTLKKGETGIGRATLRD